MMVTSPSYRSSIIKYDSHSPDFMIFMHADSLKKLNGFSWKQCLLLVQLCMCVQDLYQSTHTQYRAQTVKLSVLSLVCVFISHKKLSYYDYLITYLQQSVCLFAVYITMISTTYLKEKIFELHVMTQSKVISVLTLQN